MIACQLSYSNIHTLKGKTSHIHFKSCQSWMADIELKRKHGLQFETENSFNIQES